MKGGEEEKMEHLDDQQKQMARESLQHFKNGLDAIRKLATEVSGQAGETVKNGVTQIESGLRSILSGVKSDKEFDPTSELQDATQNTKEAGTNKPAHEGSKFNNA